MAFNHFATKTHICVDAAQINCSFWGPGRVYASDAPGLNCQDLERRNRQALDGIHYLFYLCIRVELPSPTVWCKPVLTIFCYYFNCVHVWIPSVVREPLEVKRRLSDSGDDDRVAPSVSAFPSDRVNHTYQEFTNLVAKWLKEETYE